MSADRRLSREEFEEVMRRATELAASESEGPELSEDEVYRIAGEVGLPERHVRQALEDVRARPLSPSSTLGGRGTALAGVARDGPAGPVERIFGPGVVVASRVVPGSRGDLSLRIDDFMRAGRLLQRLRRNEAVLQYRPAVDWASQIARAASSTSRRYYVASAKYVEVRLAMVEEGSERPLTRVTIEVDPGTRGEYVTGAAIGGGIGGMGVGSLAGAAVAAATGVALFAATAGVGVGVGLGMAILAGTGSAHRKKLLEVQAEVEDILDRLELEESLEPPPPSWRRWVERNFHGARKLFERSVDEDSDDGR